MEPHYAKTAPLRAAARALISRYVPAVVVGFIAGAAGCGAPDDGQLFGQARPVGDPGPTSQFGAGGGLGQGAGGTSAASGGDTTIFIGSGGEPFNPGSGGSPPSGFGGTPGRPPVGPDGGGPPPAMPDASQPPMMPAGCNFAGTWGTLIRVPVDWPAAPFVLNAGSGEVVQWNISHRMQDSLLEYHEATSLCGISLPDLDGSILSNNQKFGIRFPSAMFDRGILPSFVFKTTVSLAGSAIQWDAGPISLLTGLTMQDPATTPWPSSFSATDTPDQDADGSPGVTVLPVDPNMDPSYNWPPVGLPPYWGADYPRAARISVVVRSVSNLHGMVGGCDELDGSVDIVKIGDSPALNSMVIACTKIDGQDCSDSEAQFLNAARPQFTPTGPGTLVSVRLPEKAGCPDVRNRLPLPH